MAITRGFAIPLDATDPVRRFIMLTGIVAFEDTDGGSWLNPLDNDHLQRFIPEYNLSVLHGDLLLKPAPVPPERTVATATVGLGSLNNSDKADEWTWAVDSVETKFVGASLKLFVHLAGQGGPDGDNVFIDTVVGKITYTVIVLVT